MSLRLKLGANLSNSVSANGNGGDEFFDSTVLLMNMDGTNNGQDAADLSAAARGTPTYVNQATLQNITTLFQDTSLNLPGSQDFLTFPDSADWTPGSGNAYTVEARFRLSAVNVFNHIISQFRTTAPASLAWRLSVDSANKLRANFSTGGTAINKTLQSTATLLVDTDYEVAFTIGDDGEALEIFLLGVSEDTDALAMGTTVFNSTELLCVGADNPTVGPSSGEFNGVIYEVRVTKGINRYSANYTPLVATWPTF